MSRMVVVISLRLHKGIHNALVLILIDEDGVDSAGQLELVLKSHDVQLLGGETALAHGADVVGVQAVAHAEDSFISEPVTRSAGIFWYLIWNVSTGNFPERISKLPMRHPFAV